MFSVSLPDALRGWLEEEMQERGHESVDACAAFLLQQARQMRPPCRTFEVDGQRYRLTRLTDSDDRDAFESSIAIKAADGFHHQLYGSADLDLAETYAVCRDLFGERGEGYDDWKGGFAFPLALDVPRGKRRPAYLFRVVNYRGGVTYGLYKLVDPADSRLKNPIYYAPDPGEFSCEEIGAFARYFDAWLADHFESLKFWWKERFLLVVESNLILYGFDGKEFFTRRFDSPRKFAKSRSAWAKRFPAPPFYGQRSTTLGGETADHTETTDKRSASRRASRRI